MKVIFFSFILARLEIILNKVGPAQVRDEMCHCATQSLQFVQSFVSCESETWKVSAGRDVWRMFNSGESRLRQRKHCLCSSLVNNLYRMNKVFLLLQSFSALELLCQRVVLVFMINECDRIYIIHSNTMTKMYEMEKAVPTKINDVFVIQ